MSKKKVMHFIYSLRGGGAERQLTYLTKQLIEMGWEVHIALLELGKNSTSIENSRVIIHKLDYKTYKDPRIVIDLYRLIKCIEPDVVQTWLPLMDIYGGLATILNNKPWIISERSGVEIQNVGILAIIRRKLASLSDCIIANSEHGLEQWKVAGITPNKLKSIPNIVPIDYISSNAEIDKNDYGIDAESILFLFVGRFDQNKNTHGLIEALAFLKDSFPWKLILCGDGEERENLENMTEALGIADKCLFQGYTDRVYSWMKTVDLLVMPSLSEGMPNVVTEAAAAGCLMALSNIPAHRKIMNDSSALFFDPNDPNDIATTLKNVYINKNDYNKKIDTSRISLSKLQPKRITGLYIKIYFEVIEKITKK